jgi:hydrogenase maturation protein HypF
MTHASPAPCTDSEGHSGLRRLFIRVTGVVQGVGFRPFIHRTAVRLGLSGCVRNTFGGAEVEIEGSDEQLQAFLDSLHREPPPIARIDRVETIDMEPNGSTGFSIVQSAAVGSEAALISPDVAVCADCLREMRDPADRRHRYPFINCTNCGPRFTIVEEVPYDRPKTTMRHFPMCADCSREYEDPNDRRYHAQPNACPVCGPQLTLIDREGTILGKGDEAMVRARDLLAAGSIVAVKGLGGFHLACDATSAVAVRALRDRKKRPHKPLAVMCRDLDVVNGYCLLSEVEARELSHPRRPILLLRRLAEPDGSLPPVTPEVAPGYSDLGVMLPYTPVHELLVQDGGPACLVMTSANPTGAPIVSDNNTAVHRLGHIADAFLMHNRDIWNRCDDSVGMVDGERLVLLRRSRGFVPLPVSLPIEVRPTLALGPMMSDVFALASGSRAFLSHHIGDVETADVLAFLRESVTKLQKWLGTDPELIAHDLHPDLLTTHLARELAKGGKQLVAVQHHHAHFASALAMAGVTEDAQGLVLDGTGLGIDGTIWGCELLVGSAQKVRRAAHMRDLPLPGGDAATKRPVRITAAWLHVMVPEAYDMPLKLWDRLGRRERDVVRQMVDRAFNTPRTTSAGRLFDAVAALLGVCDQASYEGQPAIELEQFARAGDPERLELTVQLLDEHEAGIVLNPEPLFRGMVQALVDGVEPKDVAACFHKALGEGLAGLCAVIRDRGAPSTVALCGGVFQNRILVQYVASALSALGLQPLLPGETPVNDAGVALGQVVVANSAPLDAAGGAAVGWEA